MNVSNKKLNGQTKTISFQQINTRTDCDSKIANTNPHIRNYFFSKKLLTGYKNYNLENRHDGEATVLRHS